MTFALDTNTCVDLLRNKSDKMAEKLRSRKPSDFVIPTLVYAELLFGAAISRKPDENRSKIEKLIEPFAFIAFDRRAAKFYADIRKSLQKSGTLIGPNDLVIAATVIAHGATLVTNNTKEFIRVPGLQTENWRTA